MSFTLLKSNYTYTGKYVNDSSSSFYNIDYSIDIISSSNYDINDTSNVVISVYNAYIRDPSKLVYNVAADEYRYFGDNLLVGDSSTHKIVELLINILNSTEGNSVGVILPTIAVASINKTAPDYPVANHSVIGSLQITFKLSGQELLCKIDCIFNEELYHDHEYSLVVSGGIVNTMYSIIE